MRLASAPASLECGVSCSSIKGARRRAQVSYAIGVAQPLSVHVDTYGTGTIGDKEILDAVIKNFDFRPGARTQLEIFAPHSLKGKNTLHMFDSDKSSAALLA